MNSSSSNEQLRDFLRDEADDWQLVASRELDSSLDGLALRLLGRSESNGSSKTKDLQQEFGQLQAQEQLRLLNALAPQVAEELLWGWQYFLKHPLRLIAGDSATESGAGSWLSEMFWLTEMLKVVGRFRREVVTSRWLAVWGGALDEGGTADFLSLLLRQLGVTNQGLSTSHHVGRFLGATLRMARHGKRLNGDNSVTEDIYDTLALIAKGKHPTGRLGAYVVYALAHSGREDATELLIEVLRSTFQRHAESADDNSNSITMLSTCFAAAIEGMVDRPAELADVIEAALCMQTDTHSDIFPWGTIDATFVPSAGQQQNDQRVEMLKTSLAMLRNPQQRELALRDDNDPIDLLFALCVERYLAPERAFHEAMRLLSSERSWETKATVAAIAARWDSKEAIPLWQRLVEVCVEPDAPDIMLDQLLSMTEASQRGANCAPPDGSAFDALVSIGERIAKAWGPLCDLADSDEQRPRIVRRLAEVILVHRRNHSTVRLATLVDLLIHCLPKFTQVLPELTLSDEKLAQLLRLGIAQREEVLVQTVLGKASAELFLSSFPEVDAYGFQYKWENASCQHPHREEIWRAWLSSAKQKVRERVLNTLSRALRNEQLDRTAKDVAYAVLKEHEAEQAKKKRPGAEGKYVLPDLLKKCEPEDLADAAKADAKSRMQHLFRMLISRSGLQEDLFQNTPATAPKDLNVTDADLMTPAARKCRLELTSFVTSQSLTPRDLEAFRERADVPPKAELWDQWHANLAPEMREADGSHWQRALESGESWRVTREDWWRSLTNEQQERLLAVALPKPEWELKNDRIVARLMIYFRRREQSGLAADELAQQRLDVVETLLSRIPQEIQRSALKRPQNHGQTLLSTSGIGIQLKSIEAYLLSAPPGEASELRRRHANLILWAHEQTQGGYYPEVRLATAAAAHGAMSIGDFVRFIVDNANENYGTRLSLRALQREEQWWKLGVDEERESQLKLALETLETIIREQEDEPDAQLPRAFLEWYKEMPAAPKDRDLASLLRRNASIEITLQHKEDSPGELFVSRLQDLEPYDCLNDLQRLRAEGYMDDERALRLAIVHPGFVKSVAALLELPSLPQVLVWVFAHGGFCEDDLAKALGYRRNDKDDSGSPWQSLLSSIAPEVAGVVSWDFDFMKLATVRRDWYDATLGKWEEPRRASFFKTLRAVYDARTVKPLFTLLDAISGKLDRAKLVSVIDRGRSCDELLYLAILPIPPDNEQHWEIADRLAAIERLAMAGRKLKTGDAKARIAACVDQARRTLADNAGLADTTQLDWIAGAELRKELDAFRRIEIDSCLFELRVDSSGARLWITKAGKSLKTIPTAIKKTKNGMQLIDLHKRLETTFRLSRASLERAMTNQQVWDREALSMAMQHPVVAAILSELLLIDADTQKDQLAVGLFDSETDSLRDELEQRMPLPSTVRIAHPLDLASHGVLQRWQQYFVDRPPQPFPQVEREFFRLAEMETAQVGRVVLWPGFDQAVNIDQAFRIAQSHGWFDNKSHIGMDRPFDRWVARCSNWGQGSNGETIGELTFVDVTNQDTPLPLSIIPVVILSEALRDLTRCRNGAAA